MTMTTAHVKPSFDGPPDSSCTSEILVEAAGFPVGVSVGSKLGFDETPGWLLGISDSMGSLGSILILGIMETLGIMLTVGA